MASNGGTDVGRGGRGRRAALLIAATLVLGACATTDPPGSGSGPSGTNSGTEVTRTTLVTDLARPVAFTQWDETFIDPSRPTSSGAASPTASERRLVTTIYLPEGSEAQPLIVFSHGLSGHPDRFTELLSAWAEAGYVVVAPAFPLTNAQVPESNRNAADLVQQPADVEVVLDAVLRLAEDRSSALFGRVDDERIGAAGLSLGGATTYAFVFGECCRDDRIKAVEVLAGAILPAFEGAISLDGHVPLLIVHGDQDPALPHALAEDVYAQAAAPVWLVTLLGGSHATPFENSVTPFDHMVEELTVDFWDATIGQDASALARFESHAAVPGLSKVQRKSP